MKELDNVCYVVFVFSEPFKNYIHLRLGPDIWDVLTTDVKGPNPQTRTRFRHAFLKLAYAVPETVKITTADLRKALGSGFAKRLDDFENHLQQADAIVRTHAGSARQSQLEKVTGFLECKLVQSLLEKPGQESWALLKSEEVLHQFVTDLGEMLGKSIPSPWKDAVEDIEKTKACKRSKAIPAGSKDVYLGSMLFDDSMCCKHVV